MANYEATKYDFNGSNLTGIEGIPTGTIVPWSDSTAPSGFLECNGGAVSRSTYAALFAIVGTTYGVGDGSTTFNVPNFEDNVPVGKSGTKNLASTGGANTVTTTGNVAGSTANATLTTGQLATHTHNIAGIAISATLNAGGTRNYAQSATGSTGSSSGHSHNLSANFSGDATSVLQPYVAVIYIIKT